MGRSTKRWRKYCFERKPIKETREVEVVFAATCGSRENKRDAYACFENGMFTVNSLLARVQATL